MHHSLAADRASRRRRPAAGGEVDPGLEGPLGDAAHFDRALRAGAVEVGVAVDVRQRGLGARADLTELVATVDGHGRAPAPLVAEAAKYLRLPK